EKSDLVSEPTVEFFDAFRGLIHEHDWTAMFCEPCGSTLLILPCKAILRVLCELDVIRRIGIYKVVAFERNGLNVHAGERPLYKGVTVRGKVARVANPSVATKWHVELT